MQCTEQCVKANGRRIIFCTVHAQAVNAGMRFAGVQGMPHGAILLSAMPEGSLVGAQGTLQVWNGHPGGHRSILKVSDHIDCESRPHAERLMDLSES